MNLGDNCRTALGFYLASRTNGLPFAESETAERANEVRIIRRQGRYPDPAPFGVRKARQVCWLCEQRRYCARPVGWECDRCRILT